MTEFISTRGGEVVGASKVVLDGIGTYGGLYVPTELKAMELDFSALAEMSYADVQVMVLKELLSDYSEEELREAVGELTVVFGEEPVKLQKAGAATAAELYHGPTLSVRDFGAAALPKLITLGGRKNELKEKLAVLSASEGDIGAAVFRAFSEVPGMEVLVYSPKEGITTVQERLTSVQEGFNLHGAGVRAGEPDVQLNVRELLNNVEYQERLTNNGFRFSTAGTGNFGSIATLVGTLFYIYGQMLKSDKVSAGSPITLSVPTGTLSLGIAAVYAKQLGLPIDHIVLACNENSVLPEFLESGSFDADSEFTQTLTPSMNVADPTNLERLLYVLADGDTSAVANYMNSIQWMGGYDITDEMKEKLDELFSSYTIEDDDVESEIKKVYDAHQYVLDPHAAAASVAFMRDRDERGGDAPVVILETVSPLKTAELILPIIGKHASSPAEAISEMSKLMGQDIPAFLDGLFDKEKLHDKSINAEDVMSETTDILQLM